jgi:hypothetical protein
MGVGQCAKWSVRTPGRRHGTNRTIVVSQSRIAEAEHRVARKGKVVQKLESAGHPADNATGLLLVMEQSLLSMKRFLKTLERDLERSLEVEKPLRTKVARRLAKAKTDELAQQVMSRLGRGEIQADHVPVSTAPELIEDETELPIGKQDIESAVQVADEFAALAVKIVLKENPDLPVLSVIAKVRPQPR